MGIYRLPPSSTNKTITGMFIDEMTDLLTDNIPKYSNLIILGNFTISTENVLNPDTVIFSDTMAALGLQQHVQGPTHKMGNMLDLIFSQLEVQLTLIDTATHGFISDHSMVSIGLSLKKSVLPIVRKEIRDSSKVMPQNFTENYIMPSNSPNTTLDEGCYLFEEDLLKAPNQMAPLTTIKCSDKQKTPIGQ